MPLINATSIPYTGAPGVQPSADIPSTYQNIRGADAAAFGSESGAALSRLGASVEKFGDVLAEGAIRAQVQHNQVVADDYTNKFQDEANKMLYGDPSNPGSGLLEKRGSDAMSAFPVFRDVIAKSREGMRDMLQNDQQKLLFERETRRMQSIMLAHGGQHYVNESKAYATAVNEAGVKNGLDAASRAAIMQDDPGWAAGVKQSMDSFLKEARSKGLENDPGYIEQGLRRIRGEAAESKAAAMGVKDPEAAAEFVNRESASGAFPGDKGDKLHEHYTRKAMEFKARRAIEGPVSAGDAGGPGEWGPPGVEVVDELRKGGAGEAFILAAVAAGLNEGGFATNWKPAKNGEKSYGHWQNHEGGELNGYQEAYGSSQSSRDQTKYLIKRMVEESGPGILTHPDPGYILDEINTKYEKYLGNARGQRRESLGPARTYIGNIGHEMPIEMRAVSPLQGAPQPTVERPVPVVTGSGAPVTGRAAAAAEETGPAAYVGIGDSQTAHLIRPGLGVGIGGKEYNTTRRDSSTAVAGASPATIANIVDHLTPGTYTGKHVIFSPGAPNVTDYAGPLHKPELEEIDRSVKRLYENGALSVTIVGVGTANYMQGRNEQLAAIAARNNAVFSGPIDPKNVAGDGVHTKDKKAFFRQLDRARKVTMGPEPTP